MVWSPVTVEGAVSAPKSAPVNRSTDRIRSRGRLIGVATAGEQDRLHAKRLWTFDIVVIAIADVDHLAEIDAELPSH
jgi:hypothetical protein